jgi:hypothetical protein
MNKKRIVVLILSLMILGSGTLMIVRQGMSKRALKRPDIPDQVVYKHLFHHALVLKKKAEQAEKEGKDGSNFRTHFKRQASLSDEEAQTLDRIAAQWDQEMAPIEARAQALIRVYQAQFPGGQLPHGQKPPPPPAELRSLTEQRDAAVLRGRDRLKTAFGEREFERFHGFAKERVVPNVQLSQPGSASGSQKAEQ